MSTITSLKARFAKRNEEVSSSPTESEKKAAPGSSNFLRELLQSKMAPNGETVRIFPQFADPALPDHFKGQEVAVSDLLSVRVENAHRPNGSVGRHYPLVYSLSHAQTDHLIELLKLAPKGGQQSSYQRRSATPTPAAPAAQTANGGLAAEVASLKADMSALVDLLPQIIAEAAQSAKPTEGHSKGAAPAEPVQQEAEIITLAAGQVVMIDGELRQVSPDGKRLNKTIV